MNNYILKELQIKSYFTKPVYLDEVFVLATPEVPITAELISMLEKWKFKKVVSEGEPNNEYSAGQASGTGSSGTVNKEDSKTGYYLQSDADKIEKATEFYEDLVSYAEKMFVKATITKDLTYSEVIDKVRDMVEYIKEDRRFLMRVIKNSEAAEDKNYLAIHSVRSTILSIIIGTYLKLPNHRLIELGISAILHEVGMLKLPQDIYISQKPLNAAEQKAILTHPILGYTILKSFGFPLAICLTALEHHERENATGYPRRLTSDKISMYSKIIAVACSYEALSSKRPHKEAKDGYSGMLELLKNEGKQYDDTIVKALVLSLSIYPIGLYVLLSNDKKGQVIDVNPETPRFPVVQIFGEITPDGKIKTVQTAQDGLTIVRPLTRAEIET